MVRLENSYHVATLDNDADQIFQGSVEFIHAVVSGGNLERPAASAASNLEATHHGQA